MQRGCGFGAGIGRFVQARRVHPNWYVHNDVPEVADLAVGMFAESIVSVVRMTFIRLSAQRPRVDEHVGPVGRDENDPPAVTLRAVGEATAIGLHHACMVDAKPIRKAPLHRSEPERGADVVRDLQRTAFTEPSSSVPARRWGTPSGPDSPRCDSRWLRQDRWQPLSTAQSAFDSKLGLGACERDSGAAPPGEVRWNCVPPFPPLVALESPAPFLVAAATNLIALIVDHALDAAENRSRTSVSFRD